MTDRSPAPSEAQTKAAIIAMRNAIFAVGDGMSFDALMQGSVMAQTKIAVETADSPEQAVELLAFYFNIAIEAVPAYWPDKSRAREAQP